MSTRVSQPSPAEAYPAHAQLMRAFKGTMAAVRRLRGRETHRAQDGLSDAQYGLLFSLRARSPQSTGELAVAADLSPASATEMLESLAAESLVERVRSERDRRVVLTSLTDRGLELVEERRARFEPRLLAALAEFGEDDLRTAASVLDRLRELFEGLSESS